MKRGLIAMVGMLTACGVGVQGAAHNAKFLNVEDLPDDPNMSFTSTGFTIYDKTGILLAGAASAGDAYTQQQAAKESAQRQAIASGARPGDTYSYSYSHNVYAPVPGNWTYLSYDRGKGTINEREIAYSEFDLRTKLGNWKILGGRGRIGIPLGVLWLEYGGAADFTWIGMPTGVDVGYTLRKDTTVNGRVVTDPLIGAMAGLLGGDWLYLELGGRIDYRPIRWFGLYADAMLRRAPNLGASESVREWQLTAGVAFVFGDKLMPDK